MTSTPHDVSLTRSGADRLTTDQRSRLMAKVRSKDTAPEMIVRRVAHRLGFRFRLNRKDLPGTPDLVFPKHLVALFVHGCFWHRHAGCKRATVPVANAERWAEKFKANVVRDSAAAASLIDMGWRVLVIWECETKSTEELAARLEESLGRLPHPASLRLDKGAAPGDKA